MIKNQTRLILSFDDYHKDNIKIAEILKHYGLPGIFFIETLTPGAQDQIKELSKMGFEIGGHTLSHPMDLKILGASEAMSEINSGKRMIEGWTEKPCKSFAYPRGRFNDDVMEFVSIAGFDEARTTHVLHFQTPTHALAQKTTIHMFDDRSEYDVKDWYEMALKYLEKAMASENGYFHIWGHAFEFEKYNYWDKFIKICGHLQDLADDHICESIHPHNQSKA